MNQKESKKGPGNKGKEKERKRHRKKIVKVSTILKSRAKFRR